MWYAQNLAVWRLIGTYAIKIGFLENERICFPGLSNFGHVV